MRMMIEHFITFFLLILFVWIGVMYVIQNMRFTSAREFHSCVVNQIEDSNFSESVIQDCENQAKNAGYELQVERYYNGNNEDAKIRLAFPYEIPFLGIRKEYTIQGYAR